VVRVAVDHLGELSAGAYEAGLRELAVRGLDVVATPVEHLPDRNREVELVVDGFDPAEIDTYVAACAGAFGLPAKAGVVTYVSRGTDEDVEGVLAAFGLTGRVDRRIESDDEVVTVTLARADLRRVPESRLHTALEAALNSEVRIVAGP
jgi:hypothetical protein